MKQSTISILEVSKAQEIAVKQVDLGNEEEAVAEVVPQAELETTVNDYSMVEVTVLGGGKKKKKKKKKTTKFFS